MKHGKFGSRIIWFGKEGKCIENDSYLLEVSKEIGERRHMSLFQSTFWKYKQSAVQCEERESPAERCIYIRRTPQLHKVGNNPFRRKQPRHGSNLDKFSDMCIL
jgi:hypothetical protein